MMQQISRERLEALLKLEEEMKASRKKKLEAEMIDISDEEPEVHFSSGKIAKLKPAKEKRFLGRLRGKKQPKKDEYVESIRQRITEESPEILFQKWLAKKCRHGCHLCEDCVDEIQSIVQG